MVIGVGHVAWIRSASSAGPGVRVRGYAVDVHRRRRIGDTGGIIDDDDMRPLANLKRNLAGDIHAAAAATAAVHSEVPSHTFIARFASIQKIRRSLEKYPPLPVDPRIGVAVVDRALAAIDLVAG